MKPMRSMPASPVFVLLILAGVGCLLAGCVSAQTRLDTAQAQADIYNAAASNGVPALQADAIEKLASSSAAAMGHPLMMTTTGAAVQ